MLNKMIKNIILILLSLAITFAVGCKTLVENKDEGTGPIKVAEVKEAQTDEIRGVWEWEITPQESLEEEEKEDTPVQKEFSYPREEIKTEPYPVKAHKGEKIDITLNFQNADIKEVLNVILGEILEINYTLDKRVSGMITLNTTGKFYREELVNIIQATLNVNGFALVRNENLYQVTPIQEARSEAGIMSIGEDVNKRSKDIVTQIVPLKYVAPQSIIPTLRGLLTKAGFVIAPNDTHAIIISESIANMDRLLKIIETFDVPFFMGKALKFYDIKYVDAESLAKDLDSVTQTLGAKTKGKEKDVSFIPFKDINKILVATNIPDILPSIDMWISNLDVRVEENKPRFYIYKMQHEKAKETVAILTELFMGKAATSKTKLGKAAATTTATGGETMKIIADKNTNSIIIKALPADYRNIKSIIQVIDAMPQQVLIEAVIAEVTLTEALSYGVDYFLRRGDFNVPISLEPEGVTASTTSALTGGTRVFTLNTDFDAMFNLLASETEIKILSTPHILVRDEKTASIQVGKDEPIRTGTTTGTSGVSTEQIQYRDVGVILTVTPSIGENRMVTLDIVQEVSDVLPTGDNPLINSPSFTQRRTETSLVVKSGHTIYLGGIIDNDNKVSIRKVPILGDIPFIGNLFRSKEKSKSRTELMILITPYIIDTVADADMMTKEFKDKLGQVAKMINVIK